MNFVEMFLNYLDFFKIIVIITVILIIFVTFLLISIDSFTLLDESILTNLSSIFPIKNFDNNKKNKKVEIRDISNKIQNEKNKKEIKIKGFYQNEIITNSSKFTLSNKTENISNLSEKLLNNNNNDNDNKNDELSKMFIESISSLNSWNNNEIEKEIFKEINWNIEKRENNNDEEEYLISHYVYPKYVSKDNISSSNLSSSQISINSNSETDDEEKENELLSKYKLGICRIFEKSNINSIKTNIVKEVKGSLYKVYSEGSPNLIKEKCREETIPQNYNEIIVRFKKIGYNIIGIAGKKMKMNYAQSQRVERIKCESNMIFLGFVIYKVNFDN